MSESSLQTGTLLGLLDGLQAGDSRAQDELVRRTGQRLERLAHNMIRDYPAVQRWEQTADVLQNALLRLLKALREVKLENTRSFYALATTQLRRELIDLTRHYKGALGLGKNLAPHSPDAVQFEPPDPTTLDDRLERWHAFHGAVERLPVEEREVFGLQYYHGWTHVEIAKLLQVTDRSVRRYWQFACLHLNEALQGDLPFE